MLWQHLNMPLKVSQRTIKNLKFRAILFLFWFFKVRPILTADFCQKQIKWNLDAIRLFFFQTFCWPCFKPKDGKSNILTNHLQFLLLCISPQRKRDTLLCSTKSSCWKLLPSSLNINFKSNQNQDFFSVKNPEILRKRWRVEGFTMGIWL